MTSSAAIYAETLHWATARDGFGSTLAIFNYLGFAFGGLPPEKTDAEVGVRFFGEDGQELAPYRTPLATGRSLHLSLGRIHPGFQGIVAVALTPAGRIGRRRAVPGAAQRPIATSFFMLYERQGGFRDMSHELFIAGRNPARSDVEWATTLFLDEPLDPSVVIMNNRLSSKDPLCRSNVTLRLYDLRGKAITESATFELPPGGSRVLALRDAFPGFDRTSQQQVIATVTGRNLEQPMSFHRHASGDFNVHHF